MQDRTGRGGDSIGTAAGLTGSMLTNSDKLHYCPLTRLRAARIRGQTSAHRTAHCTHAGKDGLQPTGLATVRLCLVSVSVLGATVTTSASPEASVSVLKLG